MAVNHEPPREVTTSSGGELLAEEVVQGCWDCAETGAWDPYAAGDCLVWQREPWRSGRQVVRAARCVGDVEDDGHRALQ